MSCELSTNQLNQWYVFYGDGYFGYDCDEIIPFFNKTIGEYIGDDPHKYRSGYYYYDGQFIPYDDFSSYRSFSSLAQYVDNFVDHLLSMGVRNGYHRFDHYGFEIQYYVFLTGCEFEIYDLLGVYFEFLFCYLNVDFSKIRRLLG